jgi:Binding-protein-dependent transport system inner membrane component
VPKISLYPVFIFIFGLGDMSKIVLIFLECLYPITLQTVFGMRSAERALVWAAQNAGASRSQLFWQVLVPSAAPAIFAGIRIALPISLIVAIIPKSSVRAAASVTWWRSPRPHSSRRVPWRRSSSSLRSASCSTGLLSGCAGG